MLLQILFLTLTIINNVEMVGSFHNSYTRFPMSQQFKKSVVVASNQMHSKELNDDDDDNRTPPTPAPAHNNESPLDIEINAFLSGEDISLPDSNYLLAPNNTGPGEVVETALKSLRNMPTPEEGSAILLKFCAPLQRSEKWGTKIGAGGSSEMWKEVLRGGITPSMFYRRLRSSSFSVLFDWKSISATESYSYSSFGRQVNMDSTTVAFVNVALFFDEGIEPVLILFTLKKIDGVWLIENAVFSKQLFLQED